MISKATSSGSERDSPMNVSSLVTPARASRLSLSLGPCDRVMREGKEGGWETTRKAKEGGRELRSGGRELSGEIDGGEG